MTYNPRKQYHYGDYEELQYELQILPVSKFPNKTGLTIDNGCKRVLETLERDLLIYQNLKRSLSRGINYEEYFTDTYFSLIPLARLPLYERTNKMLIHVN